ncbi:MAG: YfdX family protein [Pseudomonadota bacterium]
MKMTRILLLGFACLILFSGMIGAQNSFAAKMEEEVIITPARPLTYSEQKQISSLAVKVLRHISNARGYIHDKNSKDAKKEINQALKLIENIRAGLPTTTIRDHIWVAQKHLSYENTEEVIPDLIPIYASLDAVEDFIPVKEVRQHVDEAKKELALADEGLLFVEIDLPLGHTERKVIEAAHLLANNEEKKADEALNDAEEGVQVISVAIYHPLLIAETSLWQASKQYARGKYEAALAALKKAKEFLKKAAKDTDEQTKKEIDALKEKIDDLEKKIGEKGKGLGEDIRETWDKTKGLFRKMVDKFK